MVSIKSGGQAEGGGQQPLRGVASQSQFPPACMRVKAAALYTGLTPRHIRSLVRRGAITHVRVGPRCLIIKRSSLDQFLDQRTIRARCEQPQDGQRASRNAAVGGQAIKGGGL